MEVPFIAAEFRFLDKAQAVKGILPLMETEIHLLIRNLTRSLIRNPIQTPILNPIHQDIREEWRGFV